MPELILEIVEGDEAGRQEALTGPIEIGRDASTTLSLQDEQMSRRHARVSAQGDLAIVEDLGSTNGTYVNEQPIEGPRALQAGDRIRVGLTVIELRTAQDVQRQPSAIRRVVPGPDVVTPFAPTAASRRKGSAATRMGATIIALLVVALTTAGVLIYYIAEPFK